MTLRPGLVIVLGASAAGKSTIAQQLARTLQLPLFAKDMFKESLFETLGCADLAQSQRLGAASMPLMYRAAQVVLQTGCACMIESTFLPAYAVRDLAALRDATFCRFVQLLVECEETVRLQRWQARLATRHPGHCDQQRGIDAPVSEFLALPGTRQRINTTSKIDIQALATWLGHILNAEL